jgi:hypothetical protein
LNCTTSVSGATVHIYDKGGTNSESGSTSNGVYFEYILTSDTGTITNKTDISYSSSTISVTKEVSRKIYMHVYADDSKNIYYVEFTKYTQTNPLFGISSSSSSTTTNFGLFNSTKIDDGTSGQILVAGASCYDPNDYTQTSSSIVQPFTNNANGVVMVNYLVSTSGYITRKIDNVYNCTTLRSNYNWSINSKKYFSFTTNTLFEL